MRQYRNRRITRIVLRCFGAYLMGSALFGAPFLIGKPAGDGIGIWVFLICFFAVGGILFALSFFIPKLPRYRDTIGAGSPVCAGCSTRLSDLKDTEVYIADGRRYCDACAKRLMEGTLKKPVQEPVYKREQTYTCAHCKKQIGEQDCVWIGDHRFCRDCANAANQIILKAERYKEPKYREPIGPTGLCSRCRSRVPLTELVFKDLTDCICRSCYQRIKRFPILHLYFNPCMQYDACETLDVCVVKDGYVVNYEESHGSNHYFVLPTGFFANSSRDGIAAILNAASPSGRGFGFGKKKRLSADDVKNNEEIRKLIDYDRERSTSHNNKCLGKPENNQSVRVNKLQKALENDEFLSFVKGEGDYFYYDRDRYRQGTTETSLVEYDIYKYYENCPDSHIDQLWENTLLDLLNSSEYDMMLSFEYFGGQFLSEVSGHAPFRFHPESYRTLQTVIEKNQKKLLKYKEWYEFGNNFAGGAYEWAQSVGQSLNKDYRKMGRVFAMHDDHGTRYVFRIHERKSAGGGGETSGYGWRDWLFFCHENDVPYLLQYNDCSEGCGWFAVPLSHEDVLKIVQGPDEEDERSDKNAAYRLWSAILWEHERKEDLIRFLHPDDVAEARELMDGGFSFHGKLTDEEIAGTSVSP